MVRGSDVVPIGYLEDSWFPVRTAVASIPRHLITLEVLEVNCLRHRAPNQNVPRSVAIHRCDDCEMVPNAVRGAFGPVYSICRFSIARFLCGPRQLNQTEVSLEYLLSAERFRLPHMESNSDLRAHEIEVPG